MEYVRNRYQAHVANRVNAHADINAVHGVCVPVQIGKNCCIQMASAAFCIA